MNKKLKIYNLYNLKKLTTFKIGGKAEYFCMPESIGQINDAFSFAKENNLDINIIGGGANVLITDGTVFGIVISTQKLKRVFVDSNFVTVGSGVSIEELNKILLDNSFTGMEFSSGLPGSIGGAVFMNARAYGSQMSDVIKKVCAVDRNGKIFNFLSKDLDFSYKKSFFSKRTDLFIFNVTLELKKDEKSLIKIRYKKNLEDRLKKEQFKFSSAGCIFKNDYDLGIPAGKLIEEVGLKGVNIGDAKVFENHANFIVNTGKAKASDVKKLIELIEEKLKKEKGIKLEREIRLIGF